MYREVNGVLPTVPDPDQLGENHMGGGAYTSNICHKQTYTGAVLCTDGLAACTPPSGPGAVVNFRRP